MYTVHDEYDLKHSRIAIVFQLSFLIVIVLLLFLLVKVWLFISSLVLILLLLYRFQQQPKLQKIAQLDQTKWSLKFQNESKVETVELDKIIEHYLYIVLYFENHSEHIKLKSVLIWKDQVPKEAWKRLLVHANM